MRHPKFEEKIKQNIVNPAMTQGAQSTYGVILSFNAQQNTASVLVAHPGSAEPGEAYYNVPCPTNMGFQGVAPSPGRPCWVTFKDGNNWFPIITHYFNHVFQEIDYNRQFTASNNVPKFMYSM